jgi:hypothetical protein
MASSYQKQSQFRKLTYGGLILVLFTATLFLRRHVLEVWADRDHLDLREQNLGEADLTGSFVNLTLIGSRGFALIFLWKAAIDFQERGQWSELNLAVTAITKLQPHYAQPWLFHSWNVAYNVPADLIRIEDKYYYIVRGMELLADGQRQNRNNPDLRYYMGQYYQGKFGPSSDEANTLRTLLQLSCIRPVDTTRSNLDERDDRDPNRLRPNGKLHVKRFEAFCRKHPQLVRRLREVLGLQTPDDIVTFLAARRNLPHFFATGQSEIKFPLLPDRAQSTVLLDFAAEDASLPDDFDNFVAARVWYTYAQEPLPPPELANRERAEELGRYRRAKSKNNILFRQDPARAQSFAAERLEKEGWFDQGWEVDAGKHGKDRWFGTSKVIVGGGHNWSGEAWAKAAKMWDEHGQANGLLRSPAELQTWAEQAKAYRDVYRVAANELDRSVRPEDLPPELRASFEVHRQLFLYHDRRNRITHFPHFDAQAHALMTKDGVTARRLFFEAHKQHQAGEDGAALHLYEEAFDHWKRLLNEHDDYRRDLETQNETYRTQVQYLRLVRDEESGRFRHLKPLFVLQDFLAQGIRPPGAPLWLPPAQLAPARDLGTPVVGPCAGLAKDGKPFISPEAITCARLRPDFTDLYPQPTK